MTSFLRDFATTQYQDHDIISIGLYHNTILMRKSNILVKGQRFLILWLFCNKNLLVMVISLWALAIIVSLTLLLLMQKGGCANLAVGRFFLVVQYCGLFVDDKPCYNSTASMMYSHSLCHFEPHKLGYPLVVLGFACCTSVISRMRL